MGEEGGEDAGAGGPGWHGQRLGPRATGSRKTERRRRPARPASPGRAAEARGASDGRCAGPRQVGARAEGRWRGEAQERHGRHRTTPRARSGWSGPEPEKAVEGEVRRIGSDVISKGRGF